MWIMTNFGILMPAAVPSNSQAATEGWDLQVRSRDRATLQKCRTRYLSHAMTSEIVATPDMDYDFRFYCMRVDFADAVQQMVTEIDYEKFKPTCNRRGNGGRKLFELYEHIWWVVYNAYPRKIKTK